MAAFLFCKSLYGLQACKVAIFQTRLMSRGSRRDQSTSLLLGRILIDGPCTQMQALLADNVGEEAHCQIHDE